MYKSLEDDCKEIYLVNSRERRDSWKSMPIDELEKKFKEEFWEWDTLKTIPIDTSTNEEKYRKIVDCILAGKMLGERYLQEIGRIDKLKERVKKAVKEGKMKKMKLTFLFSDLKFERQMEQRKEILEDLKEYGIKVLNKNKMPTFTNPETISVLNVPNKEAIERIEYWVYESGMIEDCMQIDLSSWFT